MLLAFFFFFLSFLTLLIYSNNLESQFSYATARGKFFQQLLIGCLVAAW